MIARSPSGHERNRQRPMIRYSDLLRLLVLALVLLVVSGCGRFFSKNDPLETLAVEEMYTEGKESLQKSNYGRAGRYYTRLIARFPYGPYTEQAQLELAYAQFKGGKPEDASSTINRFIRTYPAHPHIAYAFYLKALIGFERDDSALDRLAGIDTTLRDQSSLQQSFNDFAELIRRYPNTAYAADGRQRMIYLRNQMARSEISVGKYYLRRGAYVAAAARGKYVLELYPQSGLQGDALALMAESYRRLGQDTLASDARRVLELNDPAHPYLSGNWPEGMSWWRKLVPLARERG
jgi:outer membrane protein assembly factor BamD